jgi:RNA polymerase sporulation-specific sigma factor
MLNLNEELLKDCEKLVFSIVNKYACNYNKEDLYQVGINKVVEMSKKFDPSMGVKFSTYVYKHVLGEILKYIRDDKNLKVSRDIISLNRKIKNVSDEFYSSIGRYPNVLELSNLVGESPNKIEEVLCTYQNTESLDKNIELDDGSVTLSDRIYEDEKIDKLDLISLKEALSNLNEEARYLIYQRYYEGKTQTEIAKETNQTQVKVYRMERKILDELANYMKVA